MYLVTGQGTRWGDGSYHHEHCGHRCHRTQSSAGQCADRLNRRDCLDGGNLIWGVEQLIRRGGRDDMIPREYDMGYRVEDGMILAPVHFFDLHEVYLAPGGIGCRARR